VIMTISRLFPGLGAVFTSRSKGELPVRTHVEFTISRHNLIASGADNTQSRDLMARDSRGLPAFLQILLSSSLPPFHIEISNHLTNPKDIPPPRWKECHSYKSTYEGHCLLRKMEFPVMFRDLSGASTIPSSHRHIALPA
jgi:hypothetical protein